MARFLLALGIFILKINAFDTVRIIGLFPEHDNAPCSGSRPNTSAHWLTQSIAMFRTAIFLAERYKIYVDDQPINYTILQTNTNGNGFAALELLCQSITDGTQSDVVGIVGPASSTNARFLGPLAAHIELPLISYAATNAELQDIFIYETFYRTVPSDILLAEAIVQLFQYFSWTTCNIILAKDDYGYGGLKILSEVYYSEVSLEKRIIFNPQLGQFHAGLEQTLAKSRSRIILVWAGQSSSTRIVQHALEAKLFDGSHVWLMTDKIDIHTFNTTDQSKLKGILTVMPIIGNGSTFGVNEILQKEAFDAWCNSPENKNSCPDNVSTVSPYAMYAFDATWTLIQALNKSSFDNSLPSMERSSHCFNSVLKNYSNYHMHLKNTDFPGVSGIVQFSKNISNDRLGGACYGLYNIQEKRKPRYKQIMTWYGTNYRWKCYTGGNSLSIVWPGGESNNVTTDYLQLRGQHLRILVIEAPPFVMIHNISTDNHSEKDNSKPIHSPFDSLKTRNPNILIYGFIADLIRELQMQMHFDYTIDVADRTTNYHSLVESVAKENRQYDLALSDIRITANRLLKVDFSTPFHENTFRIITRKNPYSSSFSLFSFLNPFTWQVWVVIFAAVIYSSLIIYLFERENIESENHEFGIKSLFMGMCKVSCCLIMMSGDIKLRTNASRLTMVGLYALGTILFATYTANLSSFLTLNRVQPSISGMDDIKNGRFSLSRIGIVTNSAASDYFVQNISSTYYPLSTANEIYSRLLDYSIDASIWDSYILEYAVSNYYCDELSVVGVGFLKSSYGIVLPKDWPYKKDLDVHIMAIRESEKLESLEKRWLEYQGCSSSSGKVGQTNDSKDIIFPVDTMGGLFLTFFILTVIAFIFHLWERRATIKNIFCQTIHQIKLINCFYKYAQLNDISIFVDEWDPVVRYRYGMYDNSNYIVCNTEFYPSVVAAIIYNISFISPRIELILTWAFNMDGKRLFEGNRMLVTNYNLYLPISNGFKLYEKLNTKKLSIAINDTSIPLNGICTFDENNFDIQMLLFSHVDDYTVNQKENVTITFNNMELNYVLGKHYKIDANNNNIYSEWIKMGKPDYLTDEQLKYLQNYQQLKLSNIPILYEIQNNKLTLDSINISTHSIDFFEIINLDYPPL